MNQYPTWKNLLVLICVIVGIGFALPNFYGEDPALMIAKENGLTFSEQEIKDIDKFLNEDNSAFKSIEGKDGDVLIRFDTVEDQIQASDKVRAFLGRFSTVALSFAPNVPGFIDALDMKPMSLGLDLRGGVYFQFQVDLDAAVQQRLDQYVTDINKELIDQRIRRTIRKEGNSIRIELVNADDFNATRRIVRELDNLLAFENVSTQSQTAVLITMTDDQLKQRRDFAIQQNILTMRNRVNELGVAEPIIQRQGLDRIVVQLPGVQDPTQAERILGATATLEFRLVCENENAFEAEEKGRAPIGCELFNDRAGTPVLLKKKAIVTGNQLIDASQSFSQGRPAVSIRLDSKGSKSMLETTKKNLNKPMAVLFVQQRQETSEQDGAFVNKTILDKEVINIATIRGIFSSQFEITGLTVFEAKDLAILLRAGALAAPIFKIEEKTVGPSLGQDNIDKGFAAILYGLMAVIVFMIMWYKGFGLIANIGLLVNLTFIVAILSMLQASLTLPGIAGIVLTVGMATLIASLVLFTFGTGPIKGFAITLSIGILTSLFTAIIASRAIVNLVYGGKTIEKLRI